jgi:very-short-patch-repair endonuclease
MVTYRGIPVTTVARTLVELASTLSLDDLVRACHEAGVKYRTTPGQVEDVLARRPEDQGRGEAAQDPPRRHTRQPQQLERRFLDLLRGERLVLPETNRVVDGRRVDCRWPEQRLTVEIDGYRYHHSRHAWEQDRRREREARARGDDFRRYTYGDVFESPGAMLAELRAVISRAW